MPISNKTSDSVLANEPKIESWQHMDCTYNVILRRVRATTVVVVKQWVLHKLSVCVCSLRYTACNTYAPFYYLWPIPLYNIFPHCLTNGRIAPPPPKKKIERERERESCWTQKCVLIFSTKFFWNIFHSKKNWARCDNKCILVFIKVPFILVRFQCKLNFFHQISISAQIWYFMKICIVWAEFFRADR